MLTTDELSTGENAVFFDGVVGTVEAAITIPEACNNQFFAIIGHPHSLQGGTMNNKVVTTLVRVFSALHIPCGRFNFRGVGQTPGVYDAGVGESQDMLLLAEEWKKNVPKARIIYAGFSFGSYVAYRAAAQSDSSLLLSVAPPVNHFDYNEFIISQFPWIIAQGDHDEVVPAELVHKFVANKLPAPLLVRFPDAGHFFHGQLVQLKSSLLEAVSYQVPGL